MKVSVGNSRMDKKWNLVDMSLEDFRARIFSTHKTAETMEQYRNCLLYTSPSPRDA